MPEKKRPIVIIDTPKGKIEGESMDFTTVKNEPIVVDVEDGSRLKVFFTIVKVARGIDSKTKGVAFSEGDPLYHVAWSSSIVSEASPEILAKLKKER